ncbi:MAG TPA: hypothetical protein VMF06_19075 [Candidatus Limnocylindria bacterium]|jgi:hypothetical protein|nr:hypothetical protein [Candidatus Limnocylindria bacterium]
MIRHDWFPTRLGVALTCVLAIGCNQPVAKDASPEASDDHSLMVLDNHGGYSHGGRRILLRADNHYKEIRYTDVRGTGTAASGQYTFNDRLTELTLVLDGGTPELLHLVPYQNKSYWVHEADRARVVRPGEDYLRQVSLRTEP